jgi:hypothetical protein
MPTEERITIEEPAGEWTAVEVRERARYGRVATLARGVLRRSHNTRKYNTDFVRVYLQTTKEKKKTKKL